ncbi:camelysin metallo-endopeptidase [bacterium BMS3Abin01]|nr:camelysin metallo-endopeptidase [bacterium BMS3Abin01]
MNKRILISVLAVSLLAMLAGAGTYAYFSDSETSSGNSFAAGTLDLKVADNDEGYGDGVSQTWVIGNMVPGVSSVTNSMSLQNAGSVNADHIELGFSYSIDETSNPVESDTNPASAPGDMARMIEITAMTYDGVNFATSFVDANGNGWFDLEDLSLPPYSSSGGYLDNLLAPLPVQVGSQSLNMSLFFRPEAGNDIQGDILTMSVTSTLNQDASQ